MEDKNVLLERLKKDINETFLSCKLVDEHEVILILIFDLYKTYIFQLFFRQYCSTESRIRISTTEVHFRKW